MKQNFYMGRIYGEEGICAQYDRDMTSIMLPNGAIQTTPTRNITNLRPVKVVDMDDIVLKLLKKEINAAEQMLTKGCAPSFAIDSICLKIVTAAYPSTPTPTPKNEIGKVCVTEPLGKCALIRISDTNTEYVSLDSTSLNVSHKRWVCVQTGNLSSWEDLSCYELILLSEGVEE